MGVIHFDPDFSCFAGGFPFPEMAVFEREEDILNGADFFVVHLPVIQPARYWRERSHHQLDVILDADQPDQFHGPPFRVGEFDRQSGPEGASFRNEPVLGFEL